MPTIKVNISEMEAFESGLQSILSRFNSIAGQYASVSGNLDWDVAVQSNINSRLSNISREMSAELISLSKMGNFLDDAISRYAAVEAGNRWEDRSKSNTQANSIGDIVWDNLHNILSEFFSLEEIERMRLENPFSWINEVFKIGPSVNDILVGALSFDHSVIRPFTGVAESAIVSTFWNMENACSSTARLLTRIWDGSLVNIHDIDCNNFSTGEDYSEQSYLRTIVKEHSISLKHGDYASIKDKKYFSDKLNKDSKSDKNKKTKIPKQTKIPVKQINEDMPWNKELATIAELKAENKRECSALDWKTTGENDWAQGSVETKVGTAEAHAEAKAGLYVMEKGPDGKETKIFSPQVSAELGASAALVDFSSEGRIGFGENKDTLGLYGEAEVKAVSGEGKLEAKLSKKEVYVGASAEADLIKAEGSVGVSVLGADVGLSGAVKVGVGAHVEVGYTDGKLKVDVGAALGVGVDIGFEIDVQGTVDAVCSGVKSAWDGVGDFLGWW